MATASRQALVTFDEFCARIEDGQKADLIEGVIYMASPDSLENNLLSGWMYRLLGEYVEEKQLGTVYGSRVALRLSKISGPEPDVVFVSAARKSQLKKGYVAGPSDLAVEFVSPDSVDRDYDKKRQLYQKHGITEYWIIDPLQQKVLMLRLNAAGEYQEIAPQDGAFFSLAVPGFWFRAEWLWADPRPRISKVIAKLLAT